jgi:hypothetical protein
VDDDLGETTDSEEEEEAEDDTRRNRLWLGGYGCLRWAEPGVVALRLRTAFLALAGPTIVATEVSILSRVAKGICYP